MNLLFRFMLRLRLDYMYIYIYCQFVLILWIVIRIHTFHLYIFLFHYTRTGHNYFIVVHLFSRSPFKRITLYSYVRKKSTIFRVLTFFSITTTVSKHNIYLIFFRTFFFLIFNFQGITRQLIYGL